MKSEKNYETKKKTRNTVFLFIAFILAAQAAMFFLWERIQEKGAIAVVEIDGEERYRCSLLIERELVIDDTNTLVIKDGTADMIEAECPDQICVKHTPISNAGETIICLPNKVVVTIEALGGDQKPVRGDMDVIVK